MDFIKKVEDYIRENHMLDQGAGVVVGVSGGADSMCLLHILDKLKEQYRLSLAVVHVHHGIRGAEADADEAFVQEECRKRGLVCRTVHVDVPELARQEGLSEEEAGRNARYQAFEEAAREYGCERIAVAHNQNDNAETFLFHAFRGSGIRGMRGIAPCRGEVIRPLLCANRQEIEEYLAEEGVGFCTDRTNFQEDYTRNRIRHGILKRAEEEVNKKTVAHLSELSRELGQIADFLEEMAWEVYQKACLKDRRQEGNPRVRRVCLSVEALKKQHPVLLGEVLKRALEEVAGCRRDIGRVHIEALKDLLVGELGREASLPYGVKAKTRAVRMERMEVLELSCGDGEILEPMQLSLEIKTFPTDYATTDFIFHLELIKYEKNSSIPKNRYTKWFDYDKIGESLVLRTRRPGDYIVIHKCGNRKSLKSFLIDQKIPKEERDSLLLLAAGSRILWIPGIRSEEGLYVDENTKRVLVAELMRKGKDNSDGGKSECTDFEGRGR